jgi:tetratricopeptide (TPR) repeat protein
MPLHYRLRAEMLRASDGVQLWVEDFLVPRELVAYADARIAKRIAARIRNTFTAGAPSLPSSDASSAGAAEIAPGSAAIHHSRRSEAYLVEMRAKANWDTFRLPQMQEAIRDYRRALEIDPELHSARIHLMHSYLALATFGYLRGDIAAEQARKHAEALLTQSDSAARAALGWIHFFHDRDLEAATASFAGPQSAVYNPWVTVYQARFAMGQGRLSEAVALLRSAIHSDPFSPVMHWRLAWALHVAGDTDGALQQAESALRLFPNDPGALFFAAIIFAAASDPNSESAASRDLGARSVGLATHLIQIAPSLDGGYSALAYAHTRRGKIAEARALLDRQAWVSRERFVPRSFDAPALVELGEHDAALEALATAERQHCPWLFELLGDPRLRPLHREPEFQRLGNLSGHSLIEKASVA